MHRSNLIVLSSYLPAEPQKDAREACDWRVQRRCTRLLTAVEAVVTCCIGAGFLFCLGLVVSML